MTSGKSGQTIQEKRLKMKALIALILLYGCEACTDTLTIAKTNSLDGCDGLNIPCSLSQVRETVSTSTELTCIEVTCIETTGPVQNFFWK